MGLIDETGAIWLLTRDTGRDGYVEPGDTGEAAQTAGLSQTKAISAGQDWAGTRMVTPMAARSGR